MAAHFLTLQEWRRFSRLAAVGDRPDAAQPPIHRETKWTDDAKAELHLLGMNLHDLSFEVAEISDLDRRRPCLSEILEGHANRIDELMKRAPRGDQ